MDNLYTTFVATTLHGLEEVLAQEIRDLGGRDIKILKRAVQFSGDKRLLYRANLELRTTLRILIPIKQFRVRHESALYSRIKQIDWSQYMSEKGTLAVDGTTNSKYFTHSKYLAQKTKDAVVDQFRERRGRRPNVNLVAPDLRINVHIREDQCTVSLDSSGDSLHRRGYRKETLEAPINEVLAAGMILLSGWKKDCAFIDPMCGSGTLLTEAALYARNIPAQWYRESLGFQRWKDFDFLLWREILEEAEGRIVDFEHPILGFDKEFKAVRVSQRNLMTAEELEESIEIERMSFEKLEAPAERGILIMNPPYDERIKSDDINAFYSMIGDRFKQAFAGYEAWIISSNSEAIKHVGLRPSRRIALYNGPLECRFLKYELYAGTRKKK